jgi:L-fuconate dehydratase
VTQVQPEESATIPAQRAASASGTGARITALDCYDVRFPTSIEHDGSDAMNPDPDYSAAYAVLRTDDDALAGNALCFTIGRGNEVVVAAIKALRSHVVGRSVDDITADLGGFSADLINDSQLRWLGPEKGVMHMAIGAVVNAAWDLAAKVAGKPLWRLLADMTPEQIVGLVDFRYIDDALTPAEALEILHSARHGREDRIAELVRDGFPAYTTTPGWIG